MSDNAAPQDSADRDEPRFGLTRRRLLLAGAGGAGLAGFGIWGRYALGDEFERHVSEHLGLDLALGTEVLARMREELGDYEVRATGFLIATKGPADGVIPESLRRDAINAFIGPMFGLSRGLVMPYLMAGLNENVEYQACDVLRRS